MSHGESHYILLRYNDEGKIAEVVHGLIDEAADSVETVFYVAYRNGLVERISKEDGTLTYDYNYVAGKLSESREHVDSKLSLVHTFTYDASGRVGVWSTKRPEGNAWMPVQRKSYGYDAIGNTVSMELETYDPVTRGHAFISTSKFLDFDDKKNSSALFLNFVNPDHVLFKNNARTWRVELANGSVGETRYLYEYNDEGYATMQRDVNDELEIKYKFAAY
jgi:hypothetical protein